MMDAVKQCSYIYVIDLPCFTPIESFEAPYEWCRLAVDRAGAASTLTIDQQNRPFSSIFYFLLSILELSCVAFLMQRIQKGEAGRAAGMLRSPS